MICLLSLVYLGHAQTIVPGPSLPALRDRERGARTGLQRLEKNSETVHFVYFLQHWVNESYLIRAADIMQWCDFAHLVSY